MDLVVIVAAAVALLVAAIAIIMLLIRWRRNRFRFSMRAMLLTCAIIACTLFAILRFLLPLIAHRWAVQQIYESGGAVLFRNDEERAASGGGIYSDLDVDNPWQEVAFLHVTNDGAAMAVAQQLKYLPEANSLYLSSNVTDLGLAAICEAGSRSSIEVIDFFRSRVSYAGLSQIANLPKIRVLFFNSCPITDVDLASLKQLVTLRQLILLEERPNTNSNRFTERGYQEIGQLTSLDYLWLCELNVSDSAASHLQDLTNLKTLRLSRCHISDKALADLRKSLPNCKFEIFGFE